MHSRNNLYSNWWSKIVLESRNSARDFKIDTDFRIHQIQNHVYSTRTSKCTLKINGTELEQVPKIKYLGTILDDSYTSKKEINSEIEQDRASHINMKNLFSQCGNWMLNWCECESWSLDSVLERRIQVFELYTYRCHSTNLVEAERHERWGYESNWKRLLLLNSIKERKRQCLGHMMRGSKYEVLTVILDGKIAGKRFAGRRQNFWLKDLWR